MALIINRYNTKISFSEDSQLSNEAKEIAKLKKISDTSEKLNTLSKFLFWTLIIPICAIYFCIKKNILLANFKKNEHTLLESGLNYIAMDLERGFIAKVNNKIFSVSREPNKQMDEIYQRQRACWSAKEQSQNNPEELERLEREDQALVAQYSALQDQQKEESIRQATAFFSELRELNVSTLDQCIIAEKTTQKLFFNSVLPARKMILDEGAKPAPRFNYTDGRTENPQEAQYAALSVTDNGRSVVIKGSDLGNRLFHWDMDSGQKRTYLTFMTSTRVDINRQVTTIENHSERRYLPGEPEPFPYKAV